MKARLIILTLLMTLTSATYALAPSDTDQPVPADENTASDTQALATQEKATSVEVRNNSAFPIFVIQKGIKQQVDPKSVIVVDTANAPVTLTPTSGTPAIKFVTLSGKVAPCKFASCLIVQ